VSPDSIHQVYGPTMPLLLRLAKAVAALAAPIRNQASTPSTQEQDSGVALRWTALAVGGDWTWADADDLFDLASQATQT